MRDKKRIKPITDLLEKVWKEHPDLRFGQLVYFLAEEMYKLNGSVDIHFPEDDQWMTLLGNLNNSNNIKI